jgi:cellulose synthase/poly-beta-1,6-N-acetylglucosamine synthase-like glycosyltransferase
MQTKGKRLMAGPAVALKSRMTVDADVEINYRIESAQVTDRQKQLHEEPAVGIPDYDAYSRLAGNFAYLPQWAAYRVQYRSLFRTPRSRLLAGFIIVADLGFGIFFFGWLAGDSDHYPDSQSHWALTTLHFFPVLSIIAIELFRLVNIATLCISTALARDPIPVEPQPGTRVAFLTTIVPGKEPLEMVERTLAAARRIRHSGTLDVWLLDEGDDEAVKTMCRRLGVQHFSRRGVARWNQANGPHKAKTKHGNYNAWLDAHHEEYDYFISVDPDHVPQENFCERLLGYFRDPDVAFVVGPQVYGNYSSFVTRAAESQQYLFHGLLQRAANAYRCAMLVGTNNAVRIAALRGIGGLQDSITEDMATGLALHTARNPATGRRWKSVYTPDVLAVGEGPSTWTDYFTQQYRWSRGTNEVLMKNFWRRGHRLRIGQMLHYMLLMSYYPTTAIAWILGSLNAVFYLCLGISGLRVEYGSWLILYTNTAILQLTLYFWNRPHNVSPHEVEGSSGVSGMFISLLSTPIYVASLLGAVTFRKTNFVVTPKGDSVSPDRLGTFRLHLWWAMLFATALLTSVLLDHTHPAMQVWSALTLLVTLIPVAMWLDARLSGAGVRPS